MNASNQSLPRDPVWLRRLFWVVLVSGGLAGGFHWYLRIKLDSDLRVSLAAIDAERARRKAMATPTEVQSPAHQPSGQPVPIANLPFLGQAVTTAPVEFHSLLDPLSTWERAEKKASGSYDSGLPGGLDFASAAKSFRIPLTDENSQTEAAAALLRRSGRYLEVLDKMAKDYAQGPWDWQSLYDAPSYEFSAFESSGLSTIRIWGMLAKAKSLVGDPNKAAAYISTIYQAVQRYSESSNLSGAMTNVAMATVGDSALAFSLENLKSTSSLTAFSGPLLAQRNQRGLAAIHRGLLAEAERLEEMTKRSDIVEQITARHSRNYNHWDSLKTLFLDKLLLQNQLLTEAATAKYVAEYFTPEGKLAVPSDGIPSLVSTPGSSSPLKKSPIDALVRRPAPLIYAKMANNVIKREIQQDQRIISNAIEMHRIHHGSYPATLDDLRSLSPDLAKDLPLNPLDLTPYVYSLKPDGTFQVKLPPSTKKLPNVPSEWLDHPL